MYICMYVCMYICIQIHMRMYIHMFMQPLTNIALLGPRTEVTWWEKREAKLGSVCEQLKGKEARIVLSVTGAGVYANCNKLQLTAKYCKTLQHTLQHTITRCNTLQHAATHCQVHVSNWRARIHAFTLPWLGLSCMYCIATHCNKLQHNHGILRRYTNLVLRMLNWTGKAKAIKKWKEREATLNDTYADASVNVSTLVCALFIPLFLYLIYIYKI